MIPGFFAAGAMGSGSTPPVANFASVVAASLPWIWYRMDTLSGDVIEDYSANNLDGDLYGSGGVDYALNQPSLVGDGNPSTEFLTDSGYGASPFISLPSASISFMVAFKIPVAASAGMVFCPKTSGDPTVASGSTDKMLYLNTSGQLVFGMWTGAISTITTSGTYNDGQRHIAHVICGANDTEGSEMFIDGVSVGTVAKISVDTNDRYIYLAKGAASGWPGAPVTTAALRGVVDEWAAYTRKLTFTEVADQATAAGL